MKFDKNKVYTALNADELKVGSKVILADTLNTLKDQVKNDKEITELIDIKDERYGYRFTDGYGNAYYQLAYLISEPEEKKLKWTDLNIGDVITFGKRNVMVTGIDNDKDTDMHIYAGYDWFTDKRLASWKKVEE